MEKIFLQKVQRELGIEDNDAGYIDGLVLKIDGTAASTSKLPFQTWADFGWRNVAAAYSDVRVKYGDAKYLLVSITAPSLDIVEEIVKGVAEASRHFGLLYLGGDLNQGDCVVVDVAVVGYAKAQVGRRPKPGDVLYTIPHFGYTAAAYRYWSLPHPVTERGVGYLKRPDPRWPLPPLECVSASMDSSDGLADVLWTMASGVDIVVERLPTTEEVVKFAGEAGLELEELVFNGGEEFLPVFAARPGCVLESPYVPFAKVVQGEGQVWYRGERLKWRGWSYFSNF